MNNRVGIDTATVTMYLDIMFTGKPLVSKMAEMNECKVKMGFCISTSKNTTPVSGAYLLIRIGPQRPYRHLKSKTWAVK